MLGILKYISISGYANIDMQKITAHLPSLYNNK